MKINNQYQVNEVDGEIEIFRTASTLLNRKEAIEQWDFINQQINTTVTEINKTKQQIESKALETNLSEQTRVLGELEQLKTLFKVKIDSLLPELKKEFEEEILRLKLERGYIRADEKEKPALKNRIWADAMVKLDLGANIPFLRGVRDNFEKI